MLRTSASMRRQAFHAKSSTMHSMTRFTGAVPVNPGGTDSSIKEMLKSPRLLASSDHWHKLKLASKMVTVLNNLDQVQGTHHDGATNREEGPEAGSGLGLAFHGSPTATPPPGKSSGNILGLKWKAVAMGALAATKGSPEDTPSPLKVDSPPSKAAADATAAAGRPSSQ